MLTIILGFLEGFVLIISPCILPILPIVLASSFTGSKKRSVGIIIGFILTFTVFAFFSRQLVHYSGIDLNLIRHISYVLLLLFSIIMISPYLSDKFAQLTQHITTRGPGFLSERNVQSGLWGGLFVGGLIALVWTPCAGPILAAVILQTVIQSTTIISFFTLLGFSLGTALPMLIIAFYGRKIMDMFPFFRTYAVIFRQFLGLIILISVGYMIYQERSDRSSSIAQTTIKTSTYLENGLWRPYASPEISGITAWINSPPLQLNELKGKVILIDFWTYSCINCIRTIPYLKEWYKKYHQKGLEIIGVHTPEFDFEANLDNVNDAVKRNGIHYPVAVDNQFVTWRHFENHFWPAHYLINKKGNIVYEHFGEGAYDVTENNIRFLLDMDSISMPIMPVNEQFEYSQTPETYLGYARADNSISPVLFNDKVANYIFPKQLDTNAWALQGFWQVLPDKIVSEKSGAALKIHFKARNVFIVMGRNSLKPVKVKLLLNGKALNLDRGKDVNDSFVIVDKHRIYELIALNEFASGFLEVISNEPGLEVYTLTFGG